MQQKSNTNNTTSNTVVRRKRVIKTALIQNTRSQISQKDLTVIVTSALLVYYELKTKYVETTNHLYFQHIKGDINYRRSKKLIHISITIRAVSLMVK